MTIYSIRVETNFISVIFFSHIFLVKYVCMKRDRKRERERESFYCKNKMNKLYPFDDLIRLCSGEIDDWRNRSLTYQNKEIIAVYLIGYILYC